MSKKDQAFKAKLEQLCAAYNANKISHAEFHSKLGAMADQAEKNGYTRRNGGEIL